MKSERKVIAINAKICYMLSHVVRDTEKSLTPVECLTKMYESWERKNPEAAKIADGLIQKRGRPVKRVSGTNLLGV